MPKLDLSDAAVRTGSVYPEPYASRMVGRSSLRLADLGGLTQFGANLVTLKPGAQSALRHWHENEDEFVMVTAGECILIDDGGETPLSAGECAAFPAGDPNGHHLVNKSGRDATFLVIGTRAAREVAHYPDVDLHCEVANGKPSFTFKDGRAYVPPSQSDDQRDGRSA